MTYKSDGTVHILWDNGEEALRFWPVEDGSIIKIGENRKMIQRILHIDNNKYIIKDDRGKTWNATRLQ